MFLVSHFRFPWTWGVVAFLIGAVVLAYPLLRTSRLLVHGEDIMMQTAGATRNGLYRGFTFWLQRSVSWCCLEAVCTTRSTIL